jgi:hypothetical protein
MAAEEAETGRGLAAVNSSFGFETEVELGLVNERGCVSSREFQHWI